VIGIFVIACALRVLFVLVAIRTEYDPYRLLKGDLRSYAALGVSLARGEGFSDHYYGTLPDFFRDPAHVRSDRPAEPTARKPPGYPLFLALVFRVAGYRLVPVLFLQAILDAASVLLVYAVAREIGLGRWALACSALAALYYPFWTEAALILYETLLTFLTLLSIHGVLRWVARPSPTRAWWPGLAIGATLLVKPTIVPLIVVALLAGIWQRPREALGGAAVMLVAVCVVIAPWVIRNYHHSGRALLFSTYGGGHHLLLLYNRYNDDPATAIYKWPGYISEDYAGFREVVLPATETPRPDGMPLILAESRQDQARRRAAIAFAVDNPAQVLRAWRSTFANMWRLDHRGASLHRRATNLLFYVALIPFFLAGVLAALRRPDRRTMVVVGFFAASVLLHTVVASQVRYRVALMPLFFLIATLGMRQLTEWRRGRSAHP
jgi:4-amino-4-deoxy-L-arabinose transferase-like glycosyltransferase